MSGQIKFVRRFIQHVFFSFLIFTILRCLGTSHAYSAFSSYRRLNSNKRNSLTSDNILHASPRVEFEYCTGPVRYKHKRLQYISLIEVAKLIK